MDNCEALNIDNSRRNKHPRPLTLSEQSGLEQYTKAIVYSPRYSDNNFEYRHVQLPKKMLNVIPKSLFESDRDILKLLWEDEWRSLGIQQSYGWVHYEIHEPEPHILLFKRIKPPPEETQ